ncbi:hypothetical protein BKA93DRAFT_743152 [Sparassis latifolia]
MDTPSSSAAALKREIARLSGAINRHKTGEQVSRPPTYPPARPRNNVYINPNYKPPSKTSKPASSTVRPMYQQRSVAPSTAQKRDVVISGVAFESSGRSLVRKDLPKPAPASISKTLISQPTISHTTFTRNKAGTLVNTNRSYKSKASRRGRPTGRNMTLDNTRRPYQPRRLSSKRSKYSDKPCPRFTTTGVCNRGLTCMYQHDPAKIAICWNFLQGSCPNTAETCPLSHEPTPERTPLCVHFANNGRCTRSNCPFPHVRVGQRHGVCRDFAVLGYCEKGLDCDKQHVRECPDFAEKGTCTTKGCKLPHVIRANRARKIAAQTSTGSPATTPRGALSVAGAAEESALPVFAATSVESGAGADLSISPPVTAEDAQLGDEYISLTFHESESDDDHEDSDDEDEDEEEEEEGDIPHDQAERIDSNSDDV